MEWMMRVRGGRGGPGRCGGRRADRAGPVTVILRRAGHGRRHPRRPLPLGRASCLLFGKHYRDLWATPIRVEVLDLGRFAGGLRPTRRGGGKQTRSLRFQGGDGRAYQFRSTDKDPTLLVPPELRRTIAHRIVQDQISAGHPAAPLVVSPLLDATGVLHASRAWS